MIGVVSTVLNFSGMITLYTLCPECKKEHAITVKQLRINRAIVECKKCSVKFDALEFLNDTPVQRSAKPLFKLPDSALPPLPWEKKDQTKPFQRWDGNCYIAGLILVFQLHWFQGDNMVQNTTIRPWLEGVCALMPCSIAPYHNISEFKTSQVILQAGNEQELILHAIFSNEAKFKQVYPDLKLTLLSFNGDVLSQRVFSVDEYLPNRWDKTINVGEQVKVKLIIVQPPETIGGYEIELD